MRLLFKIAFLSLAFAMTTSLQAADTLMWVGGTSTDFNDITNWTGWASPAWVANDTLNIWQNTGNTPDITATPSVAFSAINIGYNSAGPVATPGMLQLDAGTVTTARFIMGNNDNGTASLFTINGGKLAVTGNAGFNVGTNIGHADLVMNGGTVSVPTGFVYIGYGNNSAGTLSMSGTSQFLDSAATGAVTPSVYVGYDAAGQSGSTGLMTMTDNASFTLNGGNETAAGVAFNVAGGAGAGTNTTGILTMAGSSTITISDTSSASHQLMIAYGNGSMKNVSGSVSLTDYASIVNTGTSSGPAFFYCGYGDVNGGGSMTLSGHSTWTQQSTAGNGRFFVGYDVNATDNTTGYLRVGDHASINCPVTNEGSYLGYNGGTGSLVLTASGSFSMSGSGGDFVLGQMGGTQCQGLIGSGFDVIFCEVEGCVENVLWENGGELTAHEKAVPAMIGGHNTKPHHGRNGKWPTQGSGPANDGGRNR